MSQKILSPSKHPGLFHYRFTIIPLGKKKGTTNKKALETQQYKLNIHTISRTRKQNPALWILDLQTEYPRKLPTKKKKRKRTKYQNLNVTFVLKLTIYILTQFSVIYTKMIGIIIKKYNL